MTSQARAPRFVRRPQGFSNRSFTRGCAALFAIGAFGLSLVPSLAGADTRVVATARQESDRLVSDGFILQGALRAARANRDGARATCLDEALTRVHVAARTARALTEAIAAEERVGDGLGVTRDSTRLHHLAERTREVVAAGRRCGMLEGTTGDNRTIVTAHVPNLPSGAEDYPR